MWGARVHGKSLYLPFSFSINLQLLIKKKKYSLKYINGYWKPNPETDWWIVSPEFLIEKVWDEAQEFALSLKGTEKRSFSYGVRLHSKNLKDYDFGKDPVNTCLGKPKNGLVIPLLSGSLKSKWSDGRNNRNYNKSWPFDQLFVSGTRYMDNHNYYHNLS